MIKKEFAVQGSLVPANSAIEELNKLGIKITKIGIDKPESKPLNTSINLNRKLKQGN